MPTNKEIAEWLRLFLCFGWFHNHARFGCRADAERNNRAIQAKEAQHGSI